MQRKYLKALGRGEYDTFEKLVSKALEPLFTPKILDSHVAPLRRLAAYERERAGELAKVALHCAQAKDLRGLRILFGCIPKDMKGYFPSSYLLQEASPNIVAWLLEGFLGQEACPRRPDACDLLEIACEDKDESKTRLIMSLLSREDFFPGDIGGKVVLAQRDYLLDIVLKNTVAASLFFPRFMDINVPAGPDLHTPLIRLFAKHWDAGRGLDPNFPKETFFRIAELLLEKGACLDRADSNGLTALMHSREFSEGVAFLIEKGASLDRVDREGRSALLHFSGGNKKGFGICRESVRGIELLLDAGADMTTTDDSGKTLFYNMAIQLSRLDYPRRGAANSSLAGWGEQLFRITSRALGALLAKGDDIDTVLPADMSFLPMGMRSILLLTAVSMLAGGAKEQEEKLRERLMESLCEVRFPPRPITPIRFLLQLQEFPPLFAPAKFFEAAASLPNSRKRNEEEGEDGLGLSKEQAERLIRVLLDTLESSPESVVAFLSKWAGKDLGEWGTREYEGINALTAGLIAHFLPPEGEVSPGCSVEVGVF